MPFPVVVCERADDRRHHVRSNGLIEDDGEPSVVLDPELPRVTASLDSAVVRRGIRRPPEPGGDREVGGGNGNRRSRDSITGVEVPRLTDFPGDDGRSRDRSIVSMPREILHPYIGKDDLHTAATF